MKRTYLTLLCIAFLGIISCADDFTDNPRLDGQDLDTYFLEEANVEKAVIGVYDLMQFNYAKDWSSVFLVKLLPGDDAGAGGSGPTDQPQLHDIDDYNTLSSSNVSITSNWDLFYRTIALTNLIIENVQDSDLSNKDRVVSEVKFFRAWCHFELTTMFGDIPLRVSVPSSAEDFPIAKSPRADVYAQIEADLLDAISFLPERSAIADNFRVSKGTAQALMGKVLVFQEKYSESLPYFQSVITNPSHDLEASPEDVWNIDHEFGIESLLEIGYVSTTARDWGNLAWGGRNESNLHIQLMGPRGDGIFDLTGTELINGWGFNLPSSKLVDAFDAAGDVNRKAATVMSEADLIAGGGAVDPTAATGGVIEDYEGAIRIKYATKTEDTSTEGVPELNYSTNFRVFRYAEVLLLAAEAYNKSSQDALARIELNKVRNRAGLSDIDSAISGNDLFEAIVDEKFLELAHEGQRFWDLVRWGKAATELAGTGYTSKNDLFPIPITEIDKNELMTIEDQNPGY